MHFFVSCSIICNSQDKEATETPIDRETDTEDVGYKHNGMLLSNKKKWDLQVCDNIGGPRGYNAKSISQGKINTIRSYWHKKSKEQNGTNKAETDPSLQTDGCQRGREWADGQNGVRGEGGTGSQNQRYSIGNVVRGTVTVLHGDRRRPRLRRAQQSAELWNHYVVPETNRTLRQLNNDEVKENKTESLWENKTKSFNETSHL